MQRQEWQRRRWTAGSIMLAVVLGACTGSGTKKPDAGDETVDAGEELDAGPKELRAFLDPCLSDTDCLSGYCLTLMINNEPTGRCTKPCVGIDECPLGLGWNCEPIENEANICSCRATGSVDACDGTDNDCDGQLDEDAACAAGQVCDSGACICPAENVCSSGCTNKKTDPFNCGTCDNVCEAGHSCVEGECKCAGLVCGGTCIDTRYDSFNCGGCGTSCEAGLECADSVCKAVDREWAAWPVQAGAAFSSEYTSVRDTRTRLLWSADLSPTPLDVDAAIAFCEGLTRDGHGDWRVPTKIELITIVDPTRSGPASNPSQFSNTPSAPLWSATPSATDASRYWAVNFDDGSVVAYPKAVSFFVRCVR